MSKTNLNPTLSLPAMIIASVFALLIIGGGFWLVLSRSEPTRQLQTVKLPAGVHPGRPSLSPRNPVP